MADRVLNAIDRKKDEISSYDKSVTRFSSDIEKYAQGDITAPELALRGLGEATGLFGEAVAYPLSAAWNALPTEGINQAVSELAQRAMSTEPAQAALGYLQENPRLARNLGSAVNVASVLPAGRAATSLPNRLAANTETMVGGFGLPFYGGGKAQQYGSFLGETIEAIPQTLTDALVPSKAATARATGLGARRRAEIAAGTEKGGDFASAIAGDYMARQQGKTISPNKASSLVDNAPIGVANYKAVGLNASTDKDKIISEVFDSADIPDTVKQRHLGDIYAGHGVNKRLNKEKQVEIAVKRPDAPNSRVIGMEATGSAGGPFITRAFFSKTPDAYLNVKKAMTKDKGAELTRKDYIELAQISGGFTKQLYNKLATPAKRKFKTKTTDNPQTVVDTVLRARLKESYNKKLTDKEKFYLDKWKQEGSPVKEIKDDMGAVVSSKSLGDIQEGNGIVHLATGHYSSAKELGGVRDTVSLDLDNMKMYTTISDGHDMFGLDPVGGHSLVTVVPTQVVDLKARKFDNARMKSRDKTAEKQAAKALEQRTGIPMNKGESPIAYNKRVIGEYQAPVELQDYLGTARRAGQAGLLTGMGINAQEGTAPEYSRKDWTAYLRNIAYNPLPYDYSND
jgi:hypothetical protein